MKFAFATKIAQHAGRVPGSSKTLSLQSADMAANVSAAVDLQTMNASVAKIATYHVRILYPELEQFTWKAAGGQIKQGCNFRCYLVSQSAGMYLQGIVRGEAKAKQAFQLYTAGSTWAMSKTCFDSKTNVQYISGPVKFMVNMGHPTILEPLTGDAASGLCHHILPGFSVAQSAMIQTDGIYFDVLGKLSDVSEKRPGGTGREACTITLLDGSKQLTGNDRFAAVDVTLFQDLQPGKTGLIECAQNLSGKVVLVIGVRSKYAASQTPPLSLTSSYSCKILLASEEVTTVKEMAALDFKNLEIDKVAENTQTTRDWTADAFLVTCNYLANVTSPATEHIFQINFCILDIPTSAASIRTKDQARLWFSSILHDVTGSINVWAPRLHKRFDLHPGLNHRELLLHEPPSWI